MRIRLEITSLTTTGDAVKVSGQGRTKGAADWRPWDVWTFTVPEHVARHYNIGKIIKIEVRP